MKKILAIFMVGTLLMGTKAKADEGMWLLHLISKLNYADMQAKGLKLTPEQLYSINNASLKDAIVSLGGFCTGEIISGEGLMLTNHHCGYDAIRTHSTVENDYLTDGFWAMNRNEEKPNEGLYVRILVRMEDVTDKVLAELNDDMTEAERQEVAKKVGGQIAAEATKGTEYKGLVKNFFHGNEYYLFVYQQYDDVRLVGAPPSSVGKYGGDTDNWMWPRHTGDFSMFRIYTGADGNSAAYAEGNVPLKPKHHLPVSLDGVKDGDFTMVFGFPGSTDRYLSSYGVEQAINKYNPTTVQIRDKKLEVMRKYMEADDATRIMLASNYAQTANYWKYYIGQTEQLKQNRVYDKKKAIEDEFAKWLNADATRKAKYGETLELLESAYKMTDETGVAGRYLLEAGVIGPQSTLYAWRLNRLMSAYFETAIGIKEAQKGKSKEEKAKVAEEAEAKMQKFIAAAKGVTEEHFAEYHQATDINLIAELW
ncbi:MAG: S46 family peptidase, partial [Schleiferiaceae bacterium]|nr:S46 family peptidase [Schleiferiaceae bacterium]